MLFQTMCHHPGIYLTIWSGAHISPETKPGTNDGNLRSPMVILLSLDILFAMYSANVRLFNGPFSLTIIHSPFFRNFHCNNISDNKATRHHIPDSKVHGANMGPTWGQQDPDGPHVGNMNLAIWGRIANEPWAKLCINFVVRVLRRRNWNLIWFEFW